jgi:putative ABC transport system permease protein
VWLQVSLPQDDLYNGPPGIPRFCQDLDQHVSTIPGVVSVGAVAHLPLEGNAGRGFQVEGRPAADRVNMPNADYTVACPNYFYTMGVPLLKGREFNHQDTVNSQGVIIINETMAHRWWENEDPVGRAIRLGGSDGPRLVVVGIAGDVHHWGLDEQVRPQFFRPYTQAAWPVMSVVVRTTAHPATFTAVVRKALAEVLPDRPVSEVETMDDIVQDSVGPRRFPTILLGTFALLALTLAAVGIIGVVSYSVAQRTHEIGVRIALGARPLDVLKLIVSGSMKWVLAGIGFGVVGSLGLMRLLGILLYEVKPTNPAVLGIVAILLTGVALLASYVPARRAAKVDPMVALRYE